MAITPTEFYDLSDKELLERMGGAQIGSPLAYAVESEFRRRALLAQIEASRHSQAAADAAKSTAKWTKYSALAIAISVGITTLSILLPSSTQKEVDPKQVEFQNRFKRDSVLVKTCSGDPRYATGPTAIAIRVYRFEQKLWYEDVDGYRNIDGEQENICDMLSISE